MRRPPSSAVVASCRRSVVGAAARRGGGHGARPRRLPTPVMAGATSSRPPGRRTPSGARREASSPSTPLALGYLVSVGASGPFLHLSWLIPLQARQDGRVYAVSSVYQNSGGIDLLLGWQWRTTLSDDAGGRERAGLPPRRPQPRGEGRASPTSTRSSSVWEAWASCAGDPAGGRGRWAGASGPWVRWRSTSPIRSGATTCGSAWCSDSARCWGWTSHEARAPRCRRAGRRSGLLACLGPYPNIGEKLDVTSRGLGDLVHHPGRRERPDPRPRAARRGPERRVHPGRRVPAAGGGDTAGHLVRPGSTTSRSPPARSSPSPTSRRSRSPPGEARPGGRSRLRGSARPPSTWSRPTFSSSRARRTSQGATARWSPAPRSSPASTRHPPPAPSTWRTWRWSHPRRGSPDSTARVSPST